MVFKMPGVKKDRSGSNIEPKILTLALSSIVYILNKAKPLFDVTLHAWQGAVNRTVL